MKVSISLCHFLCLLFHIFEVEVFELLIFLLHLYVVVNRVSFKHLEVTFANLVVCHHWNADKLHFALNVAEILLLILDGTEILGNEVDVFLNLLDSTTELFVLVFTEEGASCTEVVELSYCI